MKISLFYFEIAIKITGSAQNYRVGRVSGNTPTFFRPYIAMFPHFEDKLLISLGKKMWKHVYIAMFPHSKMCYIL